MVVDPDGSTVRAMAGPGVNRDVAHGQSGRNSILRADRRSPRRHRTFPSDQDLARWLKAITKDRNVMMLNAGFDIGWLDSVMAT